MRPEEAIAGNQGRRQVIVRIDDDLLSGTLARASVGHMVMVRRPSRLSGRCSTGLPAFQRPEHDDLHLAGNR